MERPTKAWFFFSLWTYKRCSRHSPASHTQPGPYPWRAPWSHCFRRIHHFRRDEVQCIPSHIPDYWWAALNLAWNSRKRLVPLRQSCNYGRGAKKTPEPIYVLPFTSLKPTTGRWSYTCKVQHQSQHAHWHPQNRSTLLQPYRHRHNTCPNRNHAAFLLHIHMPHSRSAMTGFAQTALLKWASQSRTISLDKLSSLFITDENLITLKFTF